VFLGNPSARVRDELWKMATERAGRGSVVQVWSAPTPQGYVYRSHNANQHSLVDHEGLMLVHVKRDKHAEKDGHEKAQKTPEDSSQADGEKPDEEDESSLTTEEPE